MFKEPTVLLLGAGASVHCGLPLGLDLNKNIKNGLAEAVSRKSSDGFWDNLEQMPRHAQFLHQPYAFLLLHLDSDPRLTKLLDGGPIHKAMKEMSKALAEQTTFVLDQFLMDNPEFDSLGKLCIAVELFRSLYQKPSARRPDATKNDGWHSRDDNWYRHLINHATDGATDRAELERETRLSIVNYNYDTTLEEFLALKFGITSRYRHADYRKCIDVMHVHGSLPTCPNGLVDFTSLLIESVRELSVVGEDVQRRNVETIITARKRAQTAIAKAQHVYVFGFGFHRFNLEILDLARVLPKVNTVCQNFDNSPRVARAIVELGIPQSNTHAGKGVHELILQDIFSGPSPLQLS